MTRRRVHLVVLAGVLLLVLASSSQARAGVVVKAPSSSLFPQGPCDKDHQWDIEIINGVLHECDCYYMPFGEPICTWYEITAQAEDPTTYRRIVRLAKAKRAHIVVRYVRVAKAVVR